jgi:hypothetical protein
VNKLKLIAWATTAGLALKTLPEERVGEFYEELTHSRSASHHLQVKGGSFRDLPPTKELAASFEEWFAFLESVKSVGQRAGGVDFTGINAHLSWPRRHSL